MKRFRKLGDGEITKKDDFWYHPKSGNKGRKLWEDIEIGRRCQNIAIDSWEICRYEDIDFLKIP